MVTLKKNIGGLALNRSIKVSFKVIKEKEMKLISDSNIGPANSCLIIPDNTISADVTNADATIACDDFKGAKLPKNSIYTIYTYYQFFFCFSQNEHNF